MNLSFYLTNESYSLSNKNLEIDSIQKITKLIQHFILLFATKNVFQTFLSFYPFFILSFFPLSFLLMGSF